jgi:PadR family transcriptional regulator, regulatory protein PadR
MRREALKGHLDMLLLAVLRGEPAHGYAVIQRLAEASGGAFELPEGTIYPALYRLERRGFLASRETAFEGRRRRVYEVTAAGERELAGNLVEWRDFSRDVGRTLEATG